MVELVGSFFIFVDQLQAAPVHAVHPVAFVKICAGFFQCTSGPVFHRRHRGVSKWHSGSTIQYTAHMSRIYPELRCSCRGWTPVGKAAAPTSQTVLRAHARVNTWLAPLAPGQMYRFKVHDKSWYQAGFYIHVIIRVIRQFRSLGFPRFLLKSAYSSAINWRRSFCFVVIQVKMVKSRLTREGLRACCPFRLASDEQKNTS